MSRAANTLLVLLPLCAFSATPPKASPPSGVKAPAPVDFQKDVRPILSDACFLCHGPDKNTRMVGLRLDTRDGAFEKRKSGSPVVAGNPQASLVYQRIMQDKAAVRMPPAISHKTLTDAQKETIRRWIQQGAPWKEHWAFSAPKHPPLPPVRQPAWAKNPIDRFILAKLEAAGLKPAPEADRRTLARRVSLDLTGLPPSPADVEAFVSDTVAQGVRGLCRQASGIAPLGRAPGKVLAGRSPVRRYPRHPCRQLQGNVALSRLGYLGIQPESPV